MPRGGGKSAEDDAGKATEAATSGDDQLVVGTDAGLDRPVKGGDDSAPRGDGSASPQSHGG